MPVGRCSDLHCAWASCNAACNRQLHSIKQSINQIAFVMLSTQYAALLWQHVEREQGASVRAMERNEIWCSCVSITKLWANTRYCSCSTPPSHSPPPPHTHTPHTRCLSRCLFVCSSECSCKRRHLFCNTILFEFLRAACASKLSK